MSKVFRQLNQTPLDFLLNYTGNIENLMSFLQSNNMNYMDFYNNPSYNITISYNNIVNTYKNLNIVIASNTKLDGDFNNDFSNDFYNIT